MVAATWKSDFDLNDEVDEIQEALRPKGFGDIDRTSVLKCLSAVHLGTIREDSLKSLRKLSKQGIRDLIERTADALLRSVDLLSTEFRMHSWDFLSYEALVIIVCYIYSHTKHLTPDQVVRVRQWFWRASLGERYKVGGENFVSRDLKKVHGFVANNEGSASDFGDPPTEKDWTDIAFRSNVSRSRAFILALAARQPRNLTNGSQIDTSAALSSYNKKQFHHIYQRAFLKRTSAPIDDNLLINICMLSAVGNNAISDADPNQYLPASAQRLGTAADSVFSTNLLPKPSVFDYAKASYSEFLAARSLIVNRFLSELCDGSLPNG